MLGKAINAEPMTIAKMLIDDGDDIVQDREVWVVDEAGMAGARDTEALLARAQDAGARVVLVGDVDQLGSVEAGRAFGQLQDAGMLTYKLEEIVRQARATPARRSRPCWRATPRRPSPCSTLASRRACRTMRGRSQAQTAEACANMPTRQPARPSSPTTSPVSSATSANTLVFDPTPPGPAGTDRRHPPRTASGRHARGERARCDRIRIARASPVLRPSRPTATRPATS